MTDLPVPRLDLTDDPHSRPHTRIAPAPGVRPRSGRRGPEGGLVVCEVASQSAPDTWYLVYETENGSLFCTCPDYLYRRRRRGEECKHLRGLRAQGLIDTTVTAARSRQVSDLSLPRIFILDLTEGTG